MTEHWRPENFDATISKYHHKTMNDVISCCKKHVNDVHLTHPNVDTILLMKFFMSSHVWQMYIQKAIDRSEYTNMVQKLCLMNVVDVFHYDNLPFDEWPQTHV